ncbi:MAG TPA: DUF2914 domain-containing protein [Candidatus Acidoferrales bacterium]|nr:DUF2914 domain-containing protein [Candidatus Acidoferrales bacterium]
MKRIVLLAVIFVGVLTLSSSLVSAQNANMKPEAGPKVVDMKLGAGIQDKQITGEDSTFALNAKVYAWMKVTGAAGDSIVVTWKHADKEYKATIGVGGSPWRTWAYKTVSAAGDWTVTVLTQSGEVLKTGSFTVK